MDKEFFTKLENTTPFFKMAAEGAAGSGKTYTLALVAIGLHKRIESKKPIVIFDTENSAKFLRPMFAQHGIDVLLKSSRSLTDLSRTMDFCESGSADVLMIDSITHVWENFLNTYQAENGRKFLQFQDWGRIKPTWKREYSDRLVMGRYHILFTGREGFTYDNEINADTGKRELIKTGVKMKVEGETAYEPDVLVRMERFEEILTDQKKVWREATVIKDRSNITDGLVFKNPTFENFAPVLDFLLSEVVEPSGAPPGSDADLVANEESNRVEETRRTILLEEIQGTLQRTGLGTGAADKKKKAGIMERLFMTLSWKKVESFTLDQLIACRDLLDKDEEVQGLINSK